MTSASTPMTTGPAISSGTAARRSRSSRTEGAPRSVAILGRSRSTTRIAPSVQATEDATATTPMWPSGP
ncbi:hypothetical protein [Streptomyces parvulus]|uniref:hypothetical protein n=1 Tax=Streptomyces parvulus TaxID=146923 RepID=UPI00367506E9